MTREATTKVYKFSELSDTAKERAREWYREGALDYEWWDCLFDDAATIADLFGLDIRQTRKTTGEGRHYYAPTIYFSGFWSQGDGASFEGSYRYKKGALKAVMAYAPKDTELQMSLPKMVKFTNKE